MSNNSSFSYEANEMHALAGEHDERAEVMREFNEGQEVLEEARAEAVARVESGFLKLAA